VVSCVSSIVIDPKTPTTVYHAGTALTGVVKSTDGGISWTPVITGLSSPSDYFYPRVSVTALAMDPQAPSTLFAAVWPVQRAAGSLFKSVDGGGSWKPTGLNETATGASITSLAIDPRNTGTVYAATDSTFTGGRPGALWKTTNGGASWENLFPSSSTNFHAVIVNPQNPSIVYAGTDTGVLASADGGANWTQLKGNGLPDGEWGRVGVTVSADGSAASS